MDLEVGYHYELNYPGWVRGWAELTDYVQFRRDSVASGMTMSDIYALAEKAKQEGKECDIYGHRVFQVTKLYVWSPPPFPEVYVTDNTGQMQRIHFTEGSCSNRDWWIEEPLNPGEETLVDGNR